jgi:hypothetical protein
MFIELMPLIERRTITITVAALKQGGIRVNVVPTALAEDRKLNEKISYSNQEKIAQVPESALHAFDDSALSHGAPDELDAQLAEQWKAFVDSHVALQRSVDSARLWPFEGRDKNRSKTILTVFGETAPSVSCSFFAAQ